MIHGGKRPLRLLGREETVGSKTGSWETGDDPGDRGQRLGWPGREEVVVAQRNGWTGLRHTQ